MAAAGGEPSAQAVSDELFQNFYTEVRQTQGGIARFECADDSVWVGRMCWLNGPGVFQPRGPADTRANENRLTFGRFCEIQPRDIVWTFVFSVEATATPLNECWAI